MQSKPKMTTIDDRGEKLKGVTEILKTTFLPDPDLVYLVVLELKLITVA